MSLQEILKQRSLSKCELCSSTSSLSVYAVPPSTDQTATTEHSLLLCSKCLEMLQNPEKQEENHWRCLSESMWSEVPAVTVVSWRILKSLNSKAWAQDLLQQLYLDEENLKWAMSAPLTSESSSASASEGPTPTRDSNGNILNDGDTVTLIKDLEVKGAGFTAKRGTIVRKISLTDNPLHIEGKVNGVQIVLIAAYLKKA
ncbi:MAG: PhnA domain-containing protein [Oligoflexia bacterium]|nr:PhnA domain-containing protein [Oligoflexia bacterium]